MFPINSINYSNAMGMLLVHWETCFSAIGVILEENFLPAFMFCNHRKEHILSFSNAQFISSQRFT